MPRSLRSYAAALLSTCTISFRPAVAGPPLTTDDTGILDPGQFEVIWAASLENTPGGDTWEMPVLDVSLGVARNLQISAVASRLIDDPDDGTRRSDFGNAQIGFKWRFLDSERLSAAVAPLFQSDIRSGAVERGVTEDTDVIAIPFVFEYRWSEWRLNVEAGYGFAQDERDEWLYGMSAVRSLTRRTEWLMGVHGNPDRHWDDHGLAMRTGVDVVLNEHFHVLVGVGTGLENSPDGEELDLDAYLGLQWYP